jgi:prevent-host-death family protein
MPVTATLPLDRADLTAAIDRTAATGERVLLTRDGQPLAAIVPAADMDWLEALEDELDAEALRRARAEWEQSGRKTVALDALVRELGLEG